MIKIVKDDKATAKIFQLSKTTPLQNALNRYSEYKSSYFECIQQIENIIMLNNRVLDKPRNRQDLSGTVNFLVNTTDKDKRDADLLISNMGQIILPEKDKMLIASIYNHMTKNFDKATQAFCKLEEEYQKYFGISIHEVGADWIDIDIRNRCKVTVGSLVVVAKRAGVIAIPASNSY